MLILFLVDLSRLIWRIRHGLFTVALVMFKIYGWEGDWIFGYLFVLLSDQMSTMLDYHLPKYNFSLSIYLSLAFEHNFSLILEFSKRTSFVLEIWIEFLLCPWSFKIDTFGSWYFYLIFNWSPIEIGLVFNWSWVDLTIIYPTQLKIHIGIQQTGCLVNIYWLSCHPLF